jgi:uncharacterized membrane protein YqiK
MFIAQVHGKPGFVKHTFTSKLRNAIVSTAVLGLAVMLPSQAAGQRSAESMQQAQQRNVEMNNMRQFDQESQEMKMARLRAETSAEVKRKNALAKAAAQEAAAAQAAAAQAAADQAAVQAPAPAAPAVPAKE